MPKKPSSTYKTRNRKQQTTSTNSMNQHALISATRRRHTYIYTLTYAPTSKPKPMGPPWRTRPRSLILEGDDGSPFRGSGGFPYWREYLLQSPARRTPTKFHAHQSGTATSPRAPLGKSGVAMRRRRRRIPQGRGGSVDPLAPPRDAVCGGGGVRTQGKHAEALSCPDKWNSTRYNLIGSAWYDCTWAAERVYEALLDGKTQS
ncbi:hypothetical protein F5Y00DRAFT_219936 [Daldinia vernicosa]|uniref:uncharacterized protein n=1 Tax=Daldinia vernicosa TaxID=114800 RepID=UPI002007F8E5|nr:uncharacterized protein F5Y00DRAFT_219936 [Daldinia vernicosa]KAI0843965.1 hypothetical protein F5Y00DRAFT_219936 [Daldinia vernicosa]